jgi:hypothetical protein
MAENKTKATEASVEAYLDSRASEQQRADCKTLMSILGRVTNESPKMWGPSIIGYGSYQYSYESGRTGEACLAGFAVRGKELVVYLAPEATGQQELRARLGPHKMGKSCLYIKRLADVDMSALEQLVVGSIAETRRRYGAGGA